MFTNDPLFSGLVKLITRLGPFGWLVTLTGIAGLIVTCLRFLFPLVFRQKIDDVSGEMGCFTRLFLSTIISFFMALAVLAFIGTALVGLRDMGSAPTPSRPIEPTVYPIMPAATQLNPNPTIAPEHTPTPDATMTIQALRSVRRATLVPDAGDLPRCEEVGDVFPCIATVLDEDPPDCLYSVARREYGLRAEQDLRNLSQLICDANKDFLRKQFEEDLTDQQKSLWQNNPCRFVHPGNLLIVPASPVP